jgi:hypothetical protein
MTVGFSDYRKRLVLGMLILACMALPEAYSQRILSGNLSATQPSTHVNTFGTNWVKVDNIAGFVPNDTILMIQMQGVGINTPDDASYGTPQNEKYGTPGKHEFLIIDAVNLPDEIVFRNNIKNSFHVNGNIQVVRVPFCHQAVVNPTLTNGPLTCDPWNPVAKKGGVLAIIVSGSLKLNADIDVTGKGLKGALDVQGAGLCRDAASTTLSRYPLTELNAGLKGEGISLHGDYGADLYPIYAKGEGPNYTGGGGGNGRYSGGGGGSHRGAGGNGGDEDDFCGLPGSGARGGFPVTPSFFTDVDRIFAGGGGGASTSPDGLSDARGGNGGGIVIIVADTIISNGGMIIVNGEKGVGPVGDGGAGGGGGAGTIALSFSNSGSNQLKLFAEGGRGGVKSGVGDGGGGGGGLIYLSKPKPANVTSYLSGGKPGNDPFSVGGTSGGDGVTVENFVPVLNGFLFNSIRSSDKRARTSATGEQADTVCSDTKPPLLLGTIPVGGKAPYTYKWQKSYDKILWTDLVTDNSSVNYTPPSIETNPKVYFRRIVYDSSIPVLSDESLPVEFTVQPYIKNNNIASDQTICYTQNPAAINPTAVIADGDGTKYNYKWGVSSDDINYTLISGTDNSGSYTPQSGLAVNTWYYKRTVNSGRCTSVSAPVTVKILPSITENKVLNVPADICNGSTFTNLQGSTESTSTVLAGGDNAFKYKWESNINDAGWTVAPGTNNLADYNPQELAEKAPKNEYYFRRVVYSGPADVCSSVSNEVNFRDYPVIKGNTLSLPLLSQTICSGSTPDKITAPKPQDGNGTFLYTWQDLTKDHSWRDIPGAVNISSVDFQPIALTDTTIFRRIAYSSACVDISEGLKVSVHKPVVNNVSLLSGLMDTTVCKGQIPHLLKGVAATGGDELAYFYQWQSSTDNITFTDVPASGTSPNYQPASLTTTTYFRRRVVSGVCTSFSAAITVNVLPLISGNTITSDQTICFNTAPSVIKGAIPTGGNSSYAYLWEQSSNGGATWGPATGTNNTADYLPAALTIPMKYRRITTSGLAGCCTDVSNIVTISIYPPLPTGRIVNTSDTIICENTNAFLKLDLSGTGNLTVYYKENSTDLQVTSVAGSTVVTRNLNASGALDIYNYSITKIVDGNGCLATSLTGSKKVNVYGIPVANAGPDQVVCGPKVSLAAIPSYGTGGWTYKFPSGQILNSTANAASMSFTLDSSLFNSGSMTRKFYWHELNWQCPSTDSVEITFLKHPDHVYAGADGPFYTFDQVLHLKNDEPQSWETGVWSVVTGSGEIDTLAGQITGLAQGSNSFLWKIKNRLETCSISDLLEIIVKSIEVPKGISPNGDIYNESLVIRGLDLATQDVELTILNSAGAKVFSTYSFSGDQSTWQDWDGRNNQGAELPEGTYYYLLKMVSRNDGAAKSSDPLKGYIILKRH